MTNKEIKEKYGATFRKVGAANELKGIPGHVGDGNVGEAMMREMAAKGDYTIYKGVPAGFDWEQFKKDIEKDVE